VGLRLLGIRSTRNWVRSSFKRVDGDVGIGVVKGRMLRVLFDDI
jgi:hypothetical protein